MTLEERIQRLEDIHACEQLQYKYEYYLTTVIKVKALLPCLRSTAYGKSRLRRHGPRS